MARVMREHRALLAGGLAGVACFLVGSFFQEAFFDGEVAFMLWLAVASIFVAARDAQRPRSGFL